MLEKILCECACVCMCMYVCEYVHSHTCVERMESLVGWLSVNLFLHLYDEEGQNMNYASPSSKILSVSTW